MNKKVIFALVIAILLLMPLISAKSGCCSRHGGVCGSECCDGSPLSAVCSGSSSTPQSSDSSSVVDAVAGGIVSTQNTSSQPSCIAQSVGSNYCEDISIYQLYQETDCSNSSKFVKLCDWKCENGDCIDRPIVQKQKTDNTSQKSSSFGFYIGVLILVALAGGYFLMRKKGIIPTEKSYSKKQELKPGSNTQNLTIKKKKGNIQKMEFVCPTCNNKLSRSVDITKKIEFKMKCPSCKRIIDIKGNIEK